MELNRHSFLPNSRGIPGSLVCNSKEETSTRHISLQIKSTQALWRKTKKNKH